MSLRNVGSGLAILDRWRFHPARIIGHTEAPDTSDFRQLTRDIYIPAGDIGFWQATFRDPAGSDFTDAAKVIANRQPFMIDVLYGDFNGGQRMITRFLLIPGSDERWLAAASHHWNLDRAEPR